MSLTIKLPLEKNISYRLIYPMVINEWWEHIPNIKGYNSYIYFDKSKEYNNELYVQYKEQEAKVFICSLKDISKKDIKTLLSGKYTQLSDAYKSKLLGNYARYWGVKDYSDLINAIEMILEPQENDYERLATTLGVNVKEILKVGEIYPIMNADKEVYWQEKNIKNWNLYNENQTNEQKN